MNSPARTLNAAQLARILLKDFQEQFAVFRECQPLTIGIDKQLLVRFPIVDRKVLRIALGLHTSSSKYLKNMAKATVRFDLEGKADAEVTQIHRAHASRVLEDRYKKEVERRKALRDVEEAGRRHQDKLKQLTEKFSRKGT